MIKINDIFSKNETADSLSILDLWAQLTESSQHQVIVSQVRTPCNIQVQLAKNVPKLNALMDELEVDYYGLGATIYTMPDEYVVNGSLCAGVFPLDRNWHRASISQVFKQQRQASIYFVDYGGYATVPFEDLKFLRRRFGELPVQALNAKFANVKFNKSAKMRDEVVINYLLGKVQHKVLEATIVGVINQNCFCLNVCERTTQSRPNCPAGTAISVNARIIMDGFGEACDDSKDSTVTTSNLNPQKQ